MNERNSKNINTDELSLSFKFRDEKATREHNLCRSIKAPNLHTVRVNVHSWEDLYIFSVSKVFFNKVMEDTMKLLQFGDIACH